MNKNIITTEDLLGYLKIPDSESKDSQEVLIRKITQQQILKGESIALRVFELTYKRVSIPQKLYIDDNNIICVKHRFSAQNIFYKPISYERNSAVYTEDQIPGLLATLIIPEEIYNTNYQFYINQQNQIVASVQAVKIDHVKNYIAYTPSNFSYLKEHPLLTYYYTNVYGVSANEKIKIRSYTKEGLVHRFPIVTKTFQQGYTYRLSYYYKEKEKEVRSTRFLNESPIAISIYVKDLSAVVSFLSKTIFWYYNEFNDYQSKWRKLFLTELTYNITDVLNSGGNIKKKVAVIYHLPEPLYYVFHNIPSLWYLLRILAKGYIRNALGINEEDLILKLLRIIYHRSTNKLKKTGTNNTDTLEEETKNNTQQNTSFVTNLVTQQVDGQLLLYKLIVELNGEQFRTYVRFIWNIWKNSSYAITTPKLNKHVAITSKSPVYLDYRSNKILGFHLDNADISWNGKLPQILIKTRVKAGTKEVPSLINIGDSGKPRYIETGDTEIIDNYEAKSYNYHPFSPVILKNSDNPTFILKGEENSSASSITLPAFLIFANNDAAFLENILTGVEYALDVATTVSGVINLIKVGRLYNILKGGKTLFFRTAQATKAITGAKAAAGLIEVSSGTVNTFLKLTGKNDTELGKTVAKYLFYLEMLSLAGEATVLLKGKLTKTAKELVENPNFEKSLDDLVKKRELDEVDKIKIRDEINKVVNGGKTPTFSKATKKVKSYWIKFLSKKGVRFEIGTENATKILNKEEALGIHITKFKNSEINEFEQIIYLHENPSTSVFLEECYHALQRLNGLTKYMPPIEVRGVTYTDVNAWEYLAKKRILDEAERNGITYEEYIFIENQLQNVLEGTY